MTHPTVRNPELRLRCGDGHPGALTDRASRCRRRRRGRPAARGRRDDACRSRDDSHGGRLGGRGSNHGRRLRLPRRQWRWNGCGFGGCRRPGSRRYCSKVGCLEPAGHLFGAARLLGGTTGLLGDDQSLELALHPPEQLSFPGHCGGGVTAVLLHLGPGATGGFTHPAQASDLDLTVGPGSPEGSTRSALLPEAARR